MCAPLPTPRKRCEAQRLPASVPLAAAPAASAASAAFARSQHLSNLAISGAHAFLKSTSPPFAAAPGRAVEMQRWMAQASRLQARSHASAPARACPDPFAWYTNAPGAPARPMHRAGPALPGPPPPPGPLWTGLVARAAPRGRSRNGGGRRRGRRGRRARRGGGAGAVPG